MCLSGRWHKLPQRLKPVIVICINRSAKALRHPKDEAI
jgi:hypothetical protein